MNDLNSKLQKLKQQYYQKFPNGLQLKRVEGEEKYSQLRGQMQAEQQGLNLSRIEANLLKIEAIENKAQLKRELGAVLHSLENIHAFIQKAGLKQSGLSTAVCDAMTATQTACDRVEDAPDD